MQEAKTMDYDEIISNLQKLAFETKDLRHKIHIIEQIKELEVSNNDK